MSRLFPAAIVLAVAFVPAAGGRAHAQSLGTFRWQLQPFCNVVTVNVTQQGAIYTVDGYDDQCGAPQRAPLVGLASLNPDGSVGFGLHVVTVPGGRGLDIDARVTVASLSGPWTDSAGNAGTFVFGAATGGSARPTPTIPAAALAPGSIGAAQLAPGVIGTLAQVRVSGICAGGQALRGVNPDGSVACTDANTVVDRPADATGTMSSIAIGADGLPIISHRDDTIRALRVTHCGNAACTAGNESRVVDGPGLFVGSYSSIAIGTDGLPVISHSNETAAALRVTHCGTVTCASGNVSTTVDDPPFSVGAFTSLGIGADGLPVISYKDLSVGGLRVTHCGNVACTAGNVSLTVDDQVEDVGAYTSIAIGSDGLPIISHSSDVSFGPLRLTHCGNVACTTGNLSTWAPGPGVLHTSLAIGADGLPVIGYQTGAGDLGVAHCTTATCQSSTFVTADDISHIVGEWVSVVIGTDGLPLLSHRDADAAALRVTHCGNAACSAGNRTTVVDDPDDLVGDYTSAAIGADGLPVISHRDSTAHALRVSKCGTRTCQ